jgi:carbon storage regulator CsrA
MLILPLKIGEWLRIGENVEILLLRRNGSQQFRVGINAPRSIRVLREGLADTTRYSGSAGEQLSSTEETAR